jgi:hypothetical protein
VMLNGRGSDQQPRRDQTIKPIAPRMTRHAENDKLAMQAIRPNHPPHITSRVLGDCARHHARALSRRPASLAGSNTWWSPRIDHQTHKGQRATHLIPVNLGLCQTAHRRPLDRPPRWSMAGVSLGPRSYCWPDVLNALLLRQRLSGARVDRLPSRVSLPACNSLTHL